MSERTAITNRIPTELLRRLQDISKRTGASQNMLVIRAVEAYVARVEKKAFQLP